MKQRYKKYRVKDSQKFGLPKRVKPYIFLESEAGYTCQINDSDYLGFPKTIVEKAPKIFIQILSKS